jgi:hypothetical protein
MKTTKKKAATKRSANKQQRERYEVPTDCEALADQVFKLLKDGETDYPIECLVLGFEEALGFLQELPEDATIRDLDLESGFFWSDEALAIIRRMQAA